MDRTTNRRELIECAIAGVALALWAPEKTSGEDCEPRPLLRRGDRIDVAGREGQILERAYCLGYDYEKRCGGCARCTVAALQDAPPFAKVDVGLFRGAACLDGGATPKGLQNCGSFTGAAMIIGHLCGRTRDEISFGDNGLPAVPVERCRKRHYDGPASHHRDGCRLGDNGFRLRRRRRTSTTLPLSPGNGPEPATTAFTTFRSEVHWPN